LRAFWISLKRSFATGLFLAAPVAVTVVVLYWAVKALTGPSRKMVYAVFDFLRVEPPPGVGILLSLVITFGLLVLLGYIGRSYVGRRGLRILDMLFSRIPFAKTVYSATKKLLDSFALQKDLERVVLVEYPRTGVWAMGFITSKHGGFPGDGEAAGYCNVFLPTTPNPTSGFLLVYHESEVTPLDISIEEGITFVMSGGVASPGLLRKAVNPS